MFFHRLLHFLVGGHFRQSLLVDGFTGLFLLNNTKNTVVKMLVEVLRIAKGSGASRALPTDIATVACGVLVDRRWASLAAVGRRLFNAVDGGQVALEDIRPIERLLRRGPRARAEAANHGPFVVGQSMSVLVVLARESFDMVLACNDRAFLGSFRLMGEHVGLEIFEDSSAVWVRASPLLFAVIINVEVTSRWALLGPA